MATLAIKERVEHQRADPTLNFVTEPIAQYLHDQPDGLEHSELVSLATRVLAAHYERFLQRGANRTTVRSGNCIGHRVLAIIVIDYGDGAVLATMKLNEE